MPAIARKRIDADRAALKRLPDRRAADGEEALVTVTGIARALPPSAA